MDEQVIIKAPKSHPKVVYKNLNERIPQPPFSVLIVGPRHRGKTVLLKHLLSKERGMYGTFFKEDNIMLYSPTYSFDTTLHSLELKNVFTPPVDMNDLLGDMMEQQEKFRSEDNMAPVLTVLEDVTQIRKAWTVLETLGYTGRHYNIHSLAIAHKLSSIPRGVRTQTQQWILFKPNEQSEWQWILDTFSRKKTQRIWENALRRCWENEYNFCYIDFERKGAENIYRSSFNEPLFTEAEISEMDGDIFYNPHVRRPKPKVEIPVEIKAE